MATKKLVFPEQIYLAWDDESGPEYATLVAFSDPKELQEIVEDGNKVAIYKLVEQGKMRVEVKIAIELDDPKSAAGKKTTTKLDV
jgi:hypothetical protein